MANKVQKKQSSSSTGTDKVKVDSSDTTADYLFNKMAAGAGISFSILNPSGNEQLQINSTMTIGGSNTQVQFNDGGVLGGDAGFTYNKTTDTITVAGAVNATGRLFSQDGLELEERGAGTDFIRIQAPISIAGGYVLTLPVDDGISGQVMTTDGGGILSWTTPSAAGITALTGDATATGPGSVAATVKGASGSFYLSGDISPTAISVTTNDYNPTGFSTASTVRLSSTTDVSITGMAAGTDGEIKILINTTGFYINILNQSSFSSAANRFILPEGQQINLGRSGGVVMFQYDATSARWRAMSSVVRLTSADSTITTSGTISYPSVAVNTSFDFVWSGSHSFQAVTNMNSALNMNGATPIRYYSGDTLSYVSFAGPATGTTIEWLLPTTDGIGALSSDGAGNLSIQPTGFEVSENITSDYTLTPTDTYKLYENEFSGMQVLLTLPDSSVRNLKYSLGVVDAQVFGFTIGAASVYFDGELLTSGQTIYSETPGSTITVFGVTDSLFYVRSSTGQWVII